MNLAFRISNNVVACVASLIFLFSIISRLDKSDKKNCVFLYIFIANIIELAIETFTCIINGQPGRIIRPLDTVCHIVLFILGPLIVYLWLKFVCLWVNDKTSSLKKEISILMPLIINGVIVLATPSSDLIFKINSDNIYSRGPLFIIPVMTTYFYLFYSFIFMYLNKNKVGRIEYLPLTLFCFFPTIGGLIQVLSYGMLLQWSITAFSLIILYTFLQQQMLQTDQLTGVWVRQKLICHLNSIKKKNSISKFSIVFIDLDEFKEINDTFGHLEGDKALITAVNLIKPNLHEGDLITRYGGDEFVILLNVESKCEIINIINEIAKSFSKYNDESKKPYKLSFSYGYELYDNDNNINAEEYIGHVDELMYSAKRKKKVKNILLGDKV